MCLGTCLSLDSVEVKFETRILGEAIYRGKAPRRTGERRAGWRRRRQPSKDVGSAEDWLLHAGAWMEARGLTSCMLAVRHWLWPEGVVMANNLSAWWWLSPADSYSAEREQLWVNSSQHSAAGRCVYQPSKGRLGRAPRIPTPGTQWEIMVPWLVSILHVAQPAHFTGENLMPRKKSWSFDFYATSFPYSQSLAWSNPAPTLVFYCAQSPAAFQSCLCLGPKASGPSLAGMLLLLLLLLWQSAKYLTFLLYWAILNNM